MSRSGMLQDRHAVVFGGGGSIGAAVARELASEGAEVFLAGRSSTTVGAVETVMRTMAIELGPAGVRVVCLRSTANPDTRTIQDATEVRAQMMGVTPDQAMARLAEGTMLKDLPHTADTARAAAFLASDRARMMTGTVLNASAGAVTD